jgi:type VI secretion system protein ImpA
MSALPVEELLSPLGADAPCGDDLEYDPAFIALEEAARGKAEQQYGDTVIPAQEPDWREVHEQALAVARRTRDLRVAVLLARSGARLTGLAAYAAGLELIAGLLEQQWDHVYPLLDADDNNDPTMRLNALAPLVDGSAGMADLRAAAIGPGRMALTVRQVELASGKADPHGDETVPSQDAIVQVVRDLAAQQAGTLDLLKQPLAAVSRIEAAIEQKVGAQGPDLKPLQIVARWLAHTATQAEAGGAVAAAAGDAGDAGTAGAAGGFAPAAVQAVGSIRSRDDVVRTLDSICKWIEQNEPTNPAPLLIRRAQRLMGKNFLEIIRDLVPDGLDQVEKIAGTTSE